MKEFSRKVARASVTAALALGMLTIPALADTSDSASTEAAEITQKTQQVLNDNNTRALLDIPYLYNQNAVTFAATNSYPATFDLRAVPDANGVARNYVSPVKFQNPYGTCWGFAAVSAAEASIMGELGKDVTQWPTSEALNLSERHLSYFSYTPLMGDDSQAGEGYHVFDPAVCSDVASLQDIPYYQEGVAGEKKYNELLFDQGGFTAYAVAMFASGVGPYLESASEVAGDITRDGVYRNNEGIVEKNRNYASDGTWFLPDDIRFITYADLEHGNILPSPAEYVNDAYTYNPAGTEAIKKELMNKRAVSVAFAADTSRPNQEFDPSQPHFINIEPNAEGIIPWAHYTYDQNAGSDHVVTIVGWDDAYSKDNFIKDHQPPADGAWIVKNSWGAKDRGFPNENKWGVDDTGYFYLSYYDKSLMCVESFDFDISTISDPHDYYIDAYDFMPAMGWQSYSSEQYSGEVKMANVYPVTDAITLKAVSCVTLAPESDVTFDFYKLEDKFTNPEQGTCVLSVPAHFEYAGYHRVNLTPQEIAQVSFKPGETYSIVVTETTQAGVTVAPYAISPTAEFVMMYNERIPDPAAKKSNYAVGVIHDKESYVFRNSQWADWKQETDTIKADQPALAIDNFPIKAYSTAIHDLQPVEAQAATCTEDGIKAHYKCTTCGLLFDENNQELAAADIVEPALGHQWQEPTFTFSDDGKTAKAHFVCSRDKAHVTDVDAVITSQVTTPADYGVKGSTTYTATATFGDKTFTATKVVQDIPALVHEVQEGNNATWTAGADTPLRFHVQGDYEKFTNIVMDSDTTAVSEEYYTKEPGSVYINLKPAYLSTLAPGTHTMTVNFTDGSCTATFTVAGTTPAKPAPADTLAKTNDPATVALGMSALTGAIAAAALAVARRKQNHN